MKNTVTKAGLALIAACSLGWFVYAGMLGGSCPPKGSGAAGVAQWSQDNCSSDDCDCLATTCNDGFTIELTDVDVDGSLVTYTYEICNIGGPPAISHHIVSLAGIDCIDNPGAAIIGCAYNGVAIDDPDNCKPGLDPTTQVNGIKIDVFGDEPDDCVTFSYTLDASALPEGYTLGIGCAVSATKAGNQDITNPDRDSPGYACVCAPVCELDEGPQPHGCSAGYWKNTNAEWAYEKTATLADVFDFGSCNINNAIKTASLAQALDFGGGSGINGGARILLRQAVAALLNAVASVDDPDCWHLAYPLTEQEVIDAVNAALQSCNEQTMKSLGADLDAYNNLGCPLDNHGDCIAD